MVIVYIIKAIRKIISKLAKLDYDPRNSPPPESTTSLPFFIGGMQVTFAFLGSSLWILFGDRSAGLELSLFLDKKAILPPVGKIKTFIDEKYTFISASLATRTVNILILLLFLSIIYSFCLVIMSLVDVVFWAVKSSVPLLFLFHFINKIRTERAEFIRNRNKDVKK